LLAPEVTRCLDRHRRANSVIGTDVGRGTD
jgi:hypothetical protein